MSKIKKIIESVVKPFEVVEEFKFCNSRNWRSDFAVLPIRTLIEIEGGCFVRGRHITPVGYIKDCEKYNETQMLGYILLRYTPQQMSEMVRDLERIMRYGVRK